MFKTTLIIFEKALIYVAFPKIQEDVLNLN